MFELWVPLTIAAAFLQNLRSALQKHLKSKLTDAGVTSVRFFYAWPFAVLYVWGLAQWGGFAVPEVSTTFLLYCLLGGVSQIVFTFLLVYLFSFRNFIVGTIYSKTEVAQVAVLGLVILGDPLSLAAVLAIALSLVGVVTLSVARTRITAASVVASLTERPTLIGLACGVFLGASVVFYRGGALSLGGQGFVMQAAFTLAVAVVMQTVIMGVYLRSREPGQITAILRNWPASLAVGVAGALASAAWFTAFTIQNAAYVRALGQIEPVFTVIASALFFKERTSAREFLGIGFIVAAIFILVLAG